MPFGFSFIHAPEIIRRSLQAGVEPLFSDFHFFFVFAASTLEQDQFSAYCFCDLFELALTKVLTVDLHLKASYGNQPKARLLLALTNLKIFPSHLIPLPFHAFSFSSLPVSPRGYWLLESPARQAFLPKGGDGANLWYRQHLAEQEPEHPDR
jgi:hypothetical protein